VKNETHPRCTAINRKFLPGIFARTALVLLLLVTVVGLSTLAKSGQYFPRTNPVRHVSLSIKMNVAHAPVVILGEKLVPVARVAPPRPTLRVTRLEQFEVAPAQRISVTVSMQHRSPPPSLA
jgi:hypothetical protein